MKKILVFTSLMLSLAACQSNEQIASRLAQSNPIMPVRMTSDTTHIVLTDYVPVLYGDTTLWKGLRWSAPEAIESLNLIGTPHVLREMDIVNRDHSIHAITFHDKSGSFAIPVLPNKPVRPSLISLSYADDQLRVGFCDSVANPTFEAISRDEVFNKHAGKYADCQYQEFLPSVEYHGNDNRRQQGNNDITHQDLGRGLGMQVRIR